MSSKSHFKLFSHLHFCAAFIHLSQLHLAIPLAHLQYHIYSKCSKISKQKRHTHNSHAQCTTATGL